MIKAKIFSLFFFTEAETVCMGLKHDPVEVATVLVEFGKEGLAIGRVRYRRPRYWQNAL